ncbi:hypothetical protein ECG_01619 [Echinococcus granulosus]|nr:hypothetical protein ECG_01619 [Echinococcus granulosus]
MDATGFEVCLPRVIVAAGIYATHVAPSLSDEGGGDSCVPQAGGRLSNTGETKKQQHLQYQQHRDEGYQQHRGSDCQTQQPIGDLVRETSVV